MGNENEAMEQAQEPVDEVDAYIADWDKANTAETAQPDDANSEIAKEQQEEAAGAATGETPDGQPAVDAAATDTPPELAWARQVYGSDDPATLAKAIRDLNAGFQTKAREVAEIRKQLESVSKAPPPAAEPEATPPPRLEDFLYDENGNENPYVRAQINERDERDAQVKFVKDFVVNTMEGAAVQATRDAGVQVLEIFTQNEEFKDPATRQRFAEMMDGFLAPYGLNMNKVAFLVDNGKPIVEDLRRVPEMARYIADRAHYCKQFFLGRKQDAAKDEISEKRRAADERNARRSGVLNPNALASPPPSKPKSIETSGMSYSEQVAKGVWKDDPAIKELDELLG